MSTPFPDILTGDKHARLIMQALGAIYDLLTEIKVTLDAIERDQ